MYESLAVLAGFAAVYSIVAGRLERSWISGPMIFVAFGFLMGPAGVGFWEGDVGGETLSVLAELTLALVLFTDAAGANLGVLRRTSRLPIRLLAIGLPLTIALGYAAGWAVFRDLGVFEIALLATMLAPTDAALGKGVVTNEAVPGPVREGLNVESGLNDGICVPILYLFLAMAAGTVGEGGVAQHGLTLFVEEVGIGLASGVGVTLAGLALISVARRVRWLSDAWIRITVLGLAFASFGLAQALGGSGFIASFVGGLLFGMLKKTHKEELLEGPEGIGDTLSLLTWVLFGAAFVPGALRGLTWEPIVYAVLSLTVIRMLPVFLVLPGLGFSRETKLFIGWFGPRGLASIVFGVIVMNEHLPNGDVIAKTVAVTVLLSIIAHGVTANPWARGLGRRSAAAT
jgi:NhaP-type Na+/H+ or K+/H+ antiporter